MYYLIWKNEGETPVAADFRLLRSAADPKPNGVTIFNTLEQVRSHLTAINKPQGKTAWVQDGKGASVSPIEYAPSADAPTEN